MRHYIDQTLLDPNHPVTVLLVGTGGTGSQVLNNLAKMSHSLRQLGHPGLYVVALDDDTVSEANLGRQAFAQSDVGQLKASILISRLNAYFGTDWTASPVRLGEDLPETVGGLSWDYIDVVITCVDSAKARIEIKKGLEKIKHMGNTFRPNEPTYWMDFGNNKDSGQVVLGTLKAVDQPKGDCVSELPTVLDLFPSMDERDSEDDTPSCSVREALLKQDLFVNSMLADFGMNLFWSLFRDGFVEVHGGFASLKQFSASPLRIDTKAWERFGYKAA